MCRTITHRHEHLNPRRWGSLDTEATFSEEKKSIVVSACLAWSDGIGTQQFVRWEVTIFSVIAFKQLNCDEPCFSYHWFVDRCSLRTHNTQIGIVPLFVWEEIARASSVVVLYAFPLVKRITNVWDGANKRERLRQTTLLRPFDFRSGHPRLQSYIDAQRRGRGDSSFITKERNQAASSAQMVIPHMVYVMWWIYDISNDMICIQRRLIRPLDFRLLFVLPLPPP